MQKNFYLLITTCLISVVLTSCTTKYYFVRHAEKACEDCTTCGLSEEGQQRANNLASILLLEDIDRIYASQCIRTQLTAQPLATWKNKPLTIYQTDKLHDFIAQLKKLKGGQNLVVGHSNQLPDMIGSLTKERVVLRPEDFDYIFILTKKQFLFNSVRLETETYQTISR